MKEYPKLVEMVPVCMLSAVAGAWAYVIGKEGTCAGEDGADPGAGRRSEQPL